MPDLKYWYKIYYGECPICGRDATYRVRIYGDKPEDSEEIYIPLLPQESYCGCQP